jgi:hypothetical protein
MKPKQLHDKLTRIILIIIIIIIILMIIIIVLKKQSKLNSQDSNLTVNRIPVIAKKGPTLRKLTPGWYQAPLLTCGCSSNKYQISFSIGCSQVRSSSSQRALVVYSLSLY